MRDRDPHGLAARVGAHAGDRHVQGHREADVMAALVGLLAEKPAGTTTDAEIRNQILTEIDRQPWGSRGSVDVIVTNGVVVLKGTIPDERERAALCVAAENVSGVKAVHDRLVWTDSISGIVIPRP